MDTVSWDYWAEIGQGFVGAVLSLVTGDPETWVIIRQSLLRHRDTCQHGARRTNRRLAAFVRFPGRMVLLAICNTGFGLPPVVVGLILSILLLRHGPLGSLNLRFIPLSYVRRLIATPHVPPASKAGRCFRSSYQPPPPSYQ